MTQELYFTITGTHYRFGNDIVERGTRVKLVKEPDNEYDSEAIKATLPGLGQIGYVANSVNTVLGESMSAGRLYDKIGDEAFGTVLYVLDRGVVCTIEKAENCRGEHVPGAVQNDGELYPGTVAWAEAQKNSEAE